MCEFLVDWVKHCFVSNFNRIPLGVYAKFSAVLRHDMTAGFRRTAPAEEEDQHRDERTRLSSAGADADGNHSYRVASRIGLVNLLGVRAGAILRSWRHRLVFNYAVIECARLSPLCTFCCV